jgi:hypothetical protein
VILVVPAAIPETTPVDEPIVATLVLLLLHGPEPDEESVVPPASQAESVPEMSPFVLAIVTTVVALHPVDNV